MDIASFPAIPTQLYVAVRQSRGEPGISAHVSDRKEGLMCMGKVGGQNKETVPSNLPQGV